MESSIREKMEVRLDLVKGKAWEIVRKLTDSTKLESEGAGEKIAGKAQEKISQIKQFFGK
jgi:uncharacterized protein YjbJ (UPF0337 family)